MSLRKITPTDLAIHSIDEMIKELKLRRAELVATLPKGRNTAAEGKVYNPRTGKKEPYGHTAKTKGGRREHGSAEQTGTADYA